MRYSTPTYFYRRYESLYRKISILSSLRKIVSLQGDQDLTERQWSVIQSQLLTIQAKLLYRLRSEGRKYLPRMNSLEAVRAINTVFGELELELSRAMSVFDLLLDIISQRTVPGLAKILAGCDVLAFESIRKPHPALSIVEPPLVYLDRGFGASILREGIRFRYQSRSPMPLIQIPYSKMQAKHTLTSILHEAGHEAVVRLGLRSILPNAFQKALIRKGAPKIIRNLFVLWTSELAPDFWTFCASGLAQASSIREIMSLPADKVFRVSLRDPHPPIFLRVLLSFEWCIHLWGRGEWDSWKKEWLEVYPLDNVRSSIQGIIRTAREYFPVINRVLFNTKFGTLNWNSIPSLFDMSEISPWKLEKVARSLDPSLTNMKGISPSTQLAVFHIVRNKSNLTEAQINKMMTTWLTKLAEQRLTQNLKPNRLVT